MVDARGTTHVPSMKQMDTKFNLSETSVKHTVGVQFGTLIRKYGNTDPYFRICLGLYSLLGILG